MKTKNHNSLELKIKPDTVFLLTAFGMLGATLVTPSFEAPMPIRASLGILLALAGVCVIQIAGVSFRRAHTTVDPARPDATSSLITTGIYSLTRNPIYVGMVLILLGWTTFLLNVASFGLITAFVAYIWRFQIIPEERALSILFKDKYEGYKSRVRRWL